MHVQFICWGNICRSPMAERIALRLAEDRDLDVQFSSAGISSEERGNPMDRRAAALLAEHGYEVEGHGARQVSEEMAEDVDLFVVAERFHGERLQQLGVTWDRIRLVTDFDPEAASGDPLPDPWYGGSEDFQATFEVLERALPKLLDELEANA